MEVSVNANMSDQATKPIAEVLRVAFELVEKEVSKDYGGTIEHLWIDFELIESYANRRPPLKFRFQKQVGGHVFKMTGLPVPLFHNVGHYSVRPDFRQLLSLPLQSVATYALGLIYTSTSVLVEKQKRLGGFDADGFRRDFLRSCHHHGYQVPQP